MNRRFMTAALSALLFTGASAFAQSTTWTIDKNHAATTFKVFEGEPSYDTVKPLVIEAIRQQELKAQTQPQP